MRVDGNSAYDKDNESRAKWKYRYTIIAIIGILLLIAVSILAFDNDPRQIAEEDNNIDITEERDDLIGKGGINVIQPVPTVDSRDSSPPPQESKKESDYQKGFTFPVNNGEIILGYSGNGLVYSKTLDQYVVHNGVDIQATADSPVLAVADGTVTKVYNDDKLGITIELTHKDGYKTRYSNLSTDRMVGEGDVVKAGDVISGVGITALFESMDPPHLHFEVWKDGKAIDPTPFLE
ncbi:MAG: M23 family metallopeptidase [Clostridiales bacterium]|jgi:murein DD-endopeptidase MepM/ murein hydrolase activator NlpD|nr:M23 family metallopeptidase [Clostridiales bacterium]